MSRSSYYHWLSDPDGKRRRKYMELDEKIRKAYFVARGRNGSPRLAKDLQIEYITVNVPLIALTNVPLSQAVN